MTPFFIISVALVFFITLYVLQDTILYTLNQNAIFKAIKNSKLTLVLIDTARVMLFLFIIVKIGANVYLMLKF